MPWRGRSGLAAGGPLKQRLHVLPRCVLSLLSSRCQRRDLTVGRIDDERSTPVSEVGTSLGKDLVVCPGHVLLGAPLGACIPAWAGCDISLHLGGFFGRQHRLVRKPRRPL